MNHSLNETNTLHLPVLLDEVLFYLDPVLEAGKVKGLDATFGRGGHSSQILGHSSEISLVALDQDPEAIEYGEKKFIPLYGDRIKFVKANFQDAKFEQSSFDFILVDLGVSSPQLDQAHRGFSFYKEGPLDMRMDPSLKLSAAKVINEFDAKDLVDIFQTLGEIQRPKKVVDAILEQRRVQDFKTTTELAELIEKKVGWRKKGSHPATLYFLALRMYVNREISGLDQALENFSIWLKPGGRLVIISFHSLEDRKVKFYFREHEFIKAIKRKVTHPSKEEIKNNPRARSAKLRAYEKEVIL